MLLTKRIIDCSLKQKIQHFKFNRKAQSNRNMGSSTAIKYSNGVTYLGNAKEASPHGKGTVTFPDGSILQGYFNEGDIGKGTFASEEFNYEGQFAAKMLNGLGRLTHRDGSVYEGAFKNGTIVNGSITERDESGNSIKEFFGLLEGGNITEGRLTTDSSAYSDGAKIQLQGKFIEGNLHGQAKYKLENGDTYEGEMYKGIRHGRGTYIAKQFTLEGTFSRDEIDGEITAKLANGDKYEGPFKDKKFHGQGRYTYKDGTVYHGDFYFGTMWGQCRIAFPPGSQVQSYEGEVSEGCFCGIGTVFYANGAIYKGFFQDGLKNGHGVYIYGANKYKCLYVMDKLVGELKLIA